MRVTFCRYFTEDVVDPIAVVAGLVQTGLYLDFFYVYVTKCVSVSLFSVRPNGMLSVLVVAEYCKDRSLSCLHEHEFARRVIPDSRSGCRCHNRCWACGFCLLKVVSGQAFYTTRLNTESVSCDRVGIRAISVSVRPSRPCKVSFTIFHQNRPLVDFVMSLTARATVCLALFLSFLTTLPSVCAAADTKVANRTIERVSSPPCPKRRMHMLSVDLPAAHTFHTCALH